MSNEVVRLNLGIYGIPTQMRYEKGFISIILLKKSHYRILQNLIGERSEDGVSGALLKFFKGEDSFWVEGEVFNFKYSSHLFKGAITYEDGNAYSVQVFSVDINLKPF